MTSRSIKQANIFCLLLLVFAFSTSCNTTKKVSGDTKAVVLSKSNVDKAIRSHHQDFKFFHGKAKAEASENGNGMGFTTQIRMKKNEYIWMAISKLGFEVARAYITPDSAFVIDRFHKEYYKEGLADYLAEYQIPFNFEELQGMFVGNTPLPKSKNGVVDNEAAIYSASYKGDDGKQFVYTIDGTTSKIKSAHITDRSRREVVTNYQDYKSTVNGQSMPHFIDHEVVDGEKSANLIMKYGEMVFGEEKNIPFEIPSHYVRVQ